MTDFTETPPVLSRRLILAGILAGLAASLAMPALATAAPYAQERMEPWWQERHQKKLQEIRQGKVDLIFIGDSITHDYELPSTAPQYDFLGLWNRFYGGRRAVNLGFNGDNTANVLWRLQNGEIAGISPKVAVVLIGTNDTIQGRGAEETKAGIDAVVAHLKTRLPRTRILLLGILPSAVSPTKTAVDQAVNTALANAYAKDGRVIFMDVGYRFLKDGTTDVGLYMDPRNDPPQPALHPDAAAQARMAEAIEPTLSKLLGDRSRIAQNP
ncbi:GDSL-type esterase/lipase family protein [Zavarzinia compransoris]|uniref:GDSL-type esterase/lipase family protein n=1 Tax=Zavarzinia marina TaxID=2911065 RepID=UPI001F261069|nr:GDSL-type esterase/lipase family protein [Zavarzinia marina]MCF4164832.1 GDSL-type esterase/lipase family protein [Zavarzinia marina]